VTNVPREVSVRRILVAGLASVAAIIFALAVPDRGRAQSINSEQMQSIFSSLTPEQQQQLIQQMSSGNGDNAGSRPDQSGEGSQRPSPAINRARSEQGGENDQSIGQTRVLRAFDTVLIDVDFLKTRTVVQSPKPPTEAGSNGTGVSTPQAAVPGTTYTTIEPPILQANERERLERLIKIIRSRNPYTLTQDGFLQLPGFAPEAVAGLTEELASRRVSADPALAALEIKITLLPLARTGEAALKPFGYDLFSAQGSNFVSSWSGPVPADYVVGPGDEFSVQLFGSQNRTLKLVVNRDGRIAFPELGPIEVGGRKFSDVQAEIESRISRQMIGVHTSLTIGTVRSIGIFVVGEVKTPGSYTVSGLSTMTTALFASGGVKPIGSLRDIQLKRAGQTVRHLDLYDLLMRGDTSNDAHLLPGDVVFVPPEAATVTVAGEVRRPAIYELKGVTTVRGLVDMAGGFSPNADTENAALDRIDEKQRRIAVDVAFNDKDLNMPLRNGDVLHISKLRPTLDSGVVLEGQVFRPGAFAWYQGIRLSDVIGSVDELKPDADQHYVMIRREQPPDRHIAVISADLSAALKDKNSAANVALEARDQITVFDIDGGRERVLKPLMDELKSQSNQAEPVQIVSISGKVKAEGDYPLELGMKVSDLIRAGGSLDDAAYGGRAELSRYTIEEGQVRRTQLISIDLAAALRGDPNANVTLHPYDALYIKEISEWTEQQRVTLVGEVRFPGNYPIQRGETLRSVIERAGGLTDLAFPEGSVFTRMELKKREQGEIDRLTGRMQNELAATSLMASRGNQATATQTFSIGQSLLGQLKSTVAVGRLVINLDQSLHAPLGSAADIALKDGDILTVPRRSQEVTVIGEVQNVTSHLYQPKLTRDDYIRLSGGTTRLADKGRIYIVRADGSVVAGGSRWVKSGSTNAIQAGDTIVVPLDTEREPALPLWTQVTTILYNIAIAVAAVHSL
jgi:polysaccharide biosynthesis/export protein